MPLLPSIKKKVPLLLTHSFPEKKKKKGNVIIFLKKQLCIIYKDVVS